MPSASDDPLTLRASDADRHAIADALANAYAEGRLSLPEYHERLDAALAAKTYAELAPLLSDLPGDPRTPVARPPQVVDHVPPPAADGCPAPAEQRVIAVLSQQRLGAELELGATTSVLAVLGEATLDLSRAVFHADVARVSVSAVLGQANVIVPCDSVVTVNVTPVLGEAKGPEPAVAGIQTSGSPRIEISGVALLGSVEVTRAPAPPDRLLPPGQRPALP